MRDAQILNTVKNYIPKVVIIFCAGLRLVLALMFLGSGIASAAVCTTGFIGGITGTYYNNKNLGGGVAGTRVDTSIDFDWTSGATGVGNQAADNFSIRWSGNFRAPTTGTYQFQTQSDDGVRLWINNVLVIDNWNDHSVATDTTGNISLVAGQSYPVKLEFYENGGVATIKLLWKLPTSSTFTTITTDPDPNPDTSATCTIACNAGLFGGAVGKYYNNINLTGTPVSRNDGAIAFNWGSNGPGVTGINTDNFSVRWDASLKVSTTGNYQFETITDDGVRLYVNNQLVIDNWTYHSQTSNTSNSIALTAGVYYPVRMEFFEGTGTAIAILNWKLSSASSYGALNACPAVLGSYGISHSGTGITCAGEPIKITAYDSTGAAINPTAGTQVTLSTSPATGTWVGGNTYSFTGTESSFIKYLQQTTSSTLNINVTDGLYSESSALDPSINFVDAALKFYGTSALASMPNQLAAVTDTNPVLKAIRTDNNTGACVAQVTGSRTVKLAYVCRNPATCVVGQTFSVAGTSVSANPNSAVNNPSYTDVTLTFDSTGTASIPINYTDVGQVSLAAQLTINPSGNNPGLTITGASSPFVVKPYRLAVSAVQAAAGVANPATLGSGTGFVSAGTPFSVFVQSRNASGNPTPNFGNESTSERNSLALAASSLSYPSGGTLTPLTNAGAFAATTPAGTFVNTGVSWKQVGSLVITPSLSDADYLGAGNIPNITNSGNVGRIYPDHFGISNLNLSNACASFAYMGLPMPLTFKLAAQATDNTTLTNFGSTYGNSVTGLSDSRAYPVYVAENSNTGDGASHSSRVVTTGVASWIAGEYDLGSAFTIQYTRQASGAPDGPLASLQLGMQLVDNLDSRSLTGIDMNALTTGTCGSNCNAKALGTAVPMRYGRLRLDSAFGPESTSLPVNFMTEYWVGNYFAVNANDSCTQVPRSAVIYPAGNIASDANRTVSLTSGSTQGSYGNLTPNYIVFNAGNVTHSFSAPGAGGRGSFNVSVDMTGLPWLSYDWNQDGNFYDTLLKASYSFDSYRGNDRIIYWREILQ
jgi:MSHA biogenesis protein MshQ